MKQLRLIKEDFDTLDVDSIDFDLQYSRIFDCPVARAYKRIYGVRVWVEQDAIYLLTNSRFVPSLRIKGDVDEIKRVAKSLASGAKYGIIKVYETR